MMNELDRTGAADCGAATRRSAPLRILALSADLSVPYATIRMLGPLAELARLDGHDLRARPFAFATRADLQWAGCVVIQRGAGLAARRLQQQALQMGRPVVYEIDDLLTELPPEMVQHRALRRKTRSIIAMVRDATFVSTSTQPLADALAALNPHRRVVPNHGHKIAGLAGARHDAGLRPQATLLLAASDRMQLDVIAPALRAVLARHGDAVELVGVAEAAVALRALGLPVRAQPLMWRDDFQCWVAGLVNPIGLIPLSASRFNACKSAVKFFDYALLGVPALCSRVTPYVEVVDHGRTGLLIGDDAAAWEAAIEGLLSDVDERRRIAAGAAEWVRHQAGLKQTLAAWRGLFAELPRQVDARPPDAATRVVEALIDTALAIRHSLRRVNRWRLATRSRRRTKPDPPGSR